MTLGEKKAKLQSVKGELLQHVVILLLFLASTIFTGILVGFGKGLMWPNITDLAVSSCALGVWIAHFMNNLKIFTRLRKEVKEEEEK